jgi:hypothetical protein
MSETPGKYSRSIYLHFTYYMHFFPLRSSFLERFLTQLSFVHGRHYVNY